MEGYEAKKGTTTVGIKGKDYVVLAADKLASMGDLQANRHERKIFPISDHMAITTAGLIGDAQILTRFLKARINRMKIELGEEPSVRPIATYLGTILNANKFTPYFIQFLIGGVVDKPELYSIDAAGGVSEEKNFAATGSGSPVAYGVLEANFKEGMTAEDAVKLAIQAVEAARRRNVFTGGAEPGIDVVLITKKGVKKYSEREIAEIKKSL